MNVLSLFGGCEYGRFCLDSAGVDVGFYLSSEIDKNAIKCANDNHNSISQVGDVTNWKCWDVDFGSVDLIIGGSPCQGFSGLGNGDNFNDPRSKLFFDFVDILNYTKSKNDKVLFMLENVEMRNKSWTEKISSLLSVDNFFINSKDHSSCSRPRNYWANFPIDYPDDEEIFFLDCIGDHEEMIMSDGWHDWWNKNMEYQIAKQYSKIPSGREKGICMTERQYASWNGNFIEVESGVIRKPHKSELAELSGLPKNYFDSVSQRQAERLSGNGWDARTVTSIFREIA